jgi:hypothetical protein
MKISLLTFFAAGAAVVFGGGCAADDKNTTRARQHEATVDGGASAWAEPSGGGIDAAWVATTTGDPDAIWEGYPSIFGEGKTYEATVEGWRRLRLSRTNPASKRFAGNDTTGVDVRIVDFRFSLRRGDETKEIIVPTFLPLEQFIYKGQTVLVRPKGPSKTGFLQVSVAGRTRFVEGYPVVFAPNRLYVAQVLRASEHYVDTTDPAYGRIASAYGSRERQRYAAQLLQLQVVTDKEQALVPVVVPASPPYRKGDLVYYRTFGSSTTGFADVQMKQRAGQPADGAE